MPTSTAHLAVAVPAERGDAARELLIGLAREDRVDDKRLESGIPQPSRLGGPCVDICGGEGDVAGVERDRLAQILGPARDALLGDSHRDTDQLQRLLQADAAQRFTRRCGEDVCRDPRGRTRGSSYHWMNEVIPACATSPDGRAARRWHVGVLRQRLFEAALIVAVARSPEIRRNHASVAAFSMAGLGGTAQPAQLAAGVARRSRRSRRTGGTSRSP